MKPADGNSKKKAKLLLRMESVGYRYPGFMEDALADIDLKMGEGDFVVLTGPSGCGKSTLAMDICGFLGGGERRGRIFFRNVEISEKSPVNLAGKIAYVNQDPEAQIVTLSVEEEVAFGLENFQVPREEIIHRVREALDAVNGSHLWGRSTLEISGGEKQKVAIASMLALRPSMLILDEPTSNLDPSSTRDVLEAIKKMHDATGITVMVLEHHLSPFLPFANHVVVMEKGKIVLQGLPEQVLSERDMLENLGVRLPGPVDLGVKRRTAQARVGHSVKRNVLSIRGLHVSRGKKRVLRGVNLDIFSGDIVALMGVNGSGKTTLLEAVLGFLKPLSGRVNVCGRATSRGLVSRTARNASMVFQNPNHQIFEPVVLEEAGFAPKNFGLDNVERRAKNALMALELENFADRRPNSLSHGQKRRLNVASSTSYNPMLLLMDEPFIGQDLLNTRIICRRICEVADRGGAALLVSHDPELVRALCDRVLLLEGGRIILDGSPEKVLVAVEEGMGEKRKGAP